MIRLMAKAVSVVRRSARFIVEWSFESLSGGALFALLDYYVWGHTTLSAYVAGFLAAVAFPWLGVRSGRGLGVVGALLARRRRITTTSRT
jgi:hypothetical protein